MAPLQPSDHVPLDRWLQELDAPVSLRIVVHSEAVTREAAGAELPLSPASRSGTERTDAEIEEENTDDKSTVVSSEAEESSLGHSQSGKTLTTVGPLTVSTNKQHHDQVYVLGEQDVGEASSEQRFEMIELLFEEPPFMFPCPFVFLGCYSSFLDETQWRTHAEFHFRSKGLPKHVMCPLRDCDKLDKRFEDGATAWSARMDHMANHHRSGEGWVLKEAFAKEKHTSLIEHLWAVRLLEPVQLMQLKQTGTLTEPAAPFVQRESRRRELRKWTGG